MSDSARISPTAHYTGYIWYRHGLSHDALSTHRGRALFYGIEPAAQAYRVLRDAPTLEDVLLQRHLIIDHLLRQRIERGELRQVIEIASGLSPRGYRFCREYGADLVYVEADLPDMARHKQSILEGAGLLGDRHRVVAVDAFSDDGPQSLEALADRELDPGEPTAIITEGLLTYFPVPAVEGLWRRLARLMKARSGGVYLSDFHLVDEAQRRRAARLFRRALGVFARGSVHVHYRDVAEVTRAAVAAGMSGVILHNPQDFVSSLGVPRTKGEVLVRVLEATVDPQ